MKMHKQDGIIHFWLVGLIAENNIPNTYLETAIFSVNSLDSPATGLFFNYWKHAYQREDATWDLLTSTELLDLDDYSGDPNSQTRLTIYAVRKQCRVFFYFLQ